MTGLGLFKYAVEPPSGIAALTGRLVDGINDSNVRMGYATLIITLTGETWAASGATFDAERQGIIDGITGSTDWNDDVRDNITVGSVVRTSNTVVTITMDDGYVDYLPSSDDTISVVVPASATSATGSVTATGSITITKLTGTASDLVVTVASLSAPLGRSSVTSSFASLGSEAARDALRNAPGLAYFPTTNGLIEDFSIASESSGNWHLGPGAGGFATSFYSLLMNIQFADDTTLRMVVRVGDNHPTTGQSTYWGDEGVIVGGNIGLDEAV